MKDQNKPLWYLFIVTFTVLLFCSTNSATAQTVPKIAEKALAATVYLEMQDSMEEKYAISNKTDTPNYINLFGCHYRM